MSSISDAIGKLADDINKKRREELIRLFTSDDIQSEFRRIRASGVYDKGSKSMKKIASYPLIVDEFFKRIYGDDYHEIPDFFKKYAKEFMVVDKI